MSHWATASTTTPVHPSPLSLDLHTFDPTYDPATSLEATCPMCRTPTTAHPDASLAHILAAKYPLTYAQRAEEDAAQNPSDTASTETVVILLGNRHALVTGEDGAGNKHDWTFFVRFSRPELVSYVRVNLHPTFRPPVVVLRGAPFEVRRLGWGYFNIEAVVVLKEGWEWVGGSEVRGELSDRKGALGLGWMLDFEGEGRQGRVRAGVRRVAREEVGVGDGDGGGEDEGSPIREPSPVEDGSPVRDVSPVRWPHMEEF